MDLSSRLALLPSSMDRPGLRKALSVISFIAALSGFQYYNGFVGRALLNMRRGFAAAISAWLEEQSGLSLLTPEGTLPLQRPAPASSSLAWETLSKRDHRRRPGHAVTEPSSSDTADAENRASSRHAGSVDSSDGTSGTSDAPNFFASTKFFACLDLKESQQLYEASQLVALDPHETLFTCGDSSAPGIFIVVEGQIGVFNSDLQGLRVRQTNTLHPGESIGDLEVLDGAARSLTCAALDEGALLVQVSQHLFLEFISAKPRTLQIYLQKAMARLWRVAHFVLNDFLDMPLPAATDPPVPWSDAEEAIEQSQQPPPTGVAGHPWSSLRPTTTNNYAASPFSFVPENASSLGSDQLWEDNSHGAVCQARRTLCSVQDVRPEVVRSAQAALEKVETAAADAEGGGIVQPGSPGQLLDGMEMAVKDAMSDKSSQVQQEAGIAAMTSAAINGGQAAAAAHGLGSITSSKSSINASSIVSATRDDERSNSFDGPADVLLGTLSAQPNAMPPTLELSPEVSPAAGSCGEVATVASGALALSIAGSLVSNGSTAAGSQPGASALAQAQRNAQVGELAKQAKIRNKVSARQEPVSAAAVSAFAVMSQQQPPPQDDRPARAHRHPLANSVPVTVPARTKMHPAHALPGLSVDQQPHTRVTSLSTYDLSHLPQAMLGSGWDVVAGGECHLPPGFGQDVSSKGLGQILCVSANRMLHKVDRPCRRFYLLLQGRLLAERPTSVPGQAEAVVTPGSLIAAAAFLSGTRSSATLRATGIACQLLAFGAVELQQLLVSAPQQFTALLLAAGQALAPLIRRFVTLGLNRVWLHSGDLIYRQGDPAASMYIIISGRARLVRRDLPPHRNAVVEDEVGRGEAVGGVYMLSGNEYDTTALCIRDSELVRMSKGSFEMLAQQSPTSVATVIENMARRIKAAAAAQSIPPHQQFDRIGKLVAEATLKSGNGSHSQSRRRGDIATIALIPAGTVAAAANAAAPVRFNSAASIASSSSRPASARGSATASAATHQLAIALRDMLSELFGKTLLLNSRSVEAMFPAAFERLGTSFYRSKITSWMAAQEEDYRFILLEADVDVTPWSRICVSQADCTLLVGPPDALPELGTVERQLLWGTALLARPRSTPSGLAATLEAEEPDWVAQFRRVELVRLHSSDAEPLGTSTWLAVRPQLTRHHHVRVTNEKDLARLARWMAGKAVGLVLSGGGSRGLAHLGVLHALDTAGIPIDVVGGTSQGAFMAALYAQGLAWGDMHKAVRHYAARMSSVRHLLQDLTLPLISLFTGKGFDNVVKETFANGSQHIEDLWLNYFCVTTNLTQGEASVHSSGTLWRLVRASMTVVGLVPPVFVDGDLLIDGGYLNNIPVDVMHHKGVDKVIVVDVEDRDDSAWQDLTPIGDEGVSGWRILWDRWMPIKRLRFGIKLPRYNQIVNTLTWMSHSQALKQMSKDYVIDLYMRPPVWQFRLMDYHLMNQIVRDSNRYAWEVISEWQHRVGGDLGTLLAAAPDDRSRVPAAGRGSRAAALRQRRRGSAQLRRHNSVSCMPQLRAKFDSPPSDTANSGLLEVRPDSFTAPATRRRRWAPALSAASLPSGGDWVLGDSPIAASSHSSASSPFSNSASDLRPLPGTQEGAQQQHLSPQAAHTVDPTDSRASKHPPPLRSATTDGSLSLAASQTERSSDYETSMYQQQQQQQQQQGRTAPMLRQITLNASDMRRLASGRLPGGAAHMVSADMGRAPSGMLPSTLASGRAFHRGNNFARMPSAVSEAALPAASGRMPGLPQPPGGLLAQRALRSAAAEGSARSPRCGTERRHFMTAARSSGTARARGRRGYGSVGSSGHSEAFADSGPTCDATAFPPPGGVLDCSSEWLGGAGEEVPGTSSRLTDLTSIGEGGEHSSDDATYAITTSDDAAVHNAFKRHTATRTRGDAVSTPSPGRSRWAAVAPAVSGGGGLTEDLRAASTRLMDDCFDDVQHDYSSNSSTDASDSSSFEAFNAEVDSSSEDSREGDMQPHTIGSSRSDDIDGDGDADVNTQARRITLADGFVPLQPRSQQAVSALDGQHIRDEPWSGFTVQSRSFS